MALVAGVLCRKHPLVQSTPLEITRVQSNSFNH